MTNNKSWRAASLAILVSVLAGCGSGTPASSPGYTSQQAPPSAGQGQQGQDPLGLSQEQQQKLQQIAQRQQPSQDQSQRMQTFIQLITADQVDEQALAAHLQGDRAQLRGQIDSMVQNLKETREVLTAEQRQKFAQLQQQQPQQGQQGQDPFEGLNLTAEQKQALQSLQPQQQSSVGIAIGQFMTTGDDQALKAAFEQDLNNMADPAAIARALASLSKEQRQKLFGLDQQQQQPQQ